MKAGQAELDREHGLGERTDEQLLNLINGAIFRLGYVRGIHEFDTVQLLGEIPKGTCATIEKIEALLDSHTGKLKIERTDGGKWRQVIE